MISTGVIIFWIILAIIAAAIYFGRRESKHSKEKFIAMIVSLPYEKREEVLRRLTPKLQAKMREELSARGLL